MRDSEFQELLEMTRQAYDKCDVKKIEAKLGGSWAYSICATRIVPNQPLLLGFNWGAKKGCPHKPQSEIPKESFIDLFRARKLGSMQRIFPYMKKYFPNQQIAEIGQSNYCFFRSDLESQISDGDLELCDPLLQRFLELAQPSRILMFSARLRRHLLSSGLLLKILKSAPIFFNRGSRACSYIAIKGSIRVNDESIRCYSLPHPNYPMKKEARDQAWKFCFG